MDVDEEDAENGSTQQPKSVHDYGIEVDFEVLSGEEREVSSPHLHADDSLYWITAQDSSGETLAEFDASITKLNAEIERMTPNMKAMDRHVPSFSPFPTCKADDNALYPDLTTSRPS